MPFSPLPSAPWLLLLPALAALPAAAADAGPEEMIVTATLRGDAVPRQLPASLAVLDEATIESAAVRHFEELTGLVPNLNWSGEGSRARYFQVRGTGELEQYEGAPNASVGFIIDDIDFSGIGGIATTFDLERVEVLRGPQGTRYGANALAGLIYARSAAPPQAPEARAEATAGGDGALGLGLAAGGPVPGLEDELAWRFAIQQFDSDGFRDNAWLGRDDTYRRDELTARGKLRWRPAPGWQADLTGLLVDLDNGYDAWALDNSFTTRSDEPGRDSQRSAAGSLRVSGPLGPALQLVSITGVADSDIVFSFDSDWANPAYWAPDVYAFSQRTDRERRTLNQELRLVSTPAARLPGAGDWLVGAYLLDLDERNHVTDLGLFDVDDAYCGSPGAPAGYCDPFASDRVIDSDYEATSVALFGEAAWPLGERTRLTVGLRGERRDADYADFLDDRASGLTDAHAFAPTDRLWGGEVAVSHDLGNATTAVARIARGYRAGGFNPGLARVAPTDDQVRFGDESLWSYEAGLRFAARGLPLTARLDAFWQEREDMQVKVPLQYQPGDPNLFIFSTDNAESGHAWGAEGEVTFAPLESLGLRAAIAWLATEVDRFNAQPAFEGHAFPHAPAVSYAVSAEWEPGGGWFARADLTGRGGYYFDYDDSTGDDRKADPAALLNLRAGRRLGRWTVEAWVRNLLDEEYAVRGFYFINEPRATVPSRYIRLGDPRQAGVTVSWRM